jgi:hypothetical protein
MWADPNLNGHVIEKTNDAVIYQFACKKGYKRTGLSFLKCWKGKWTADVPQCIAC